MIIVLAMILKWVCVLLPYFRYRIETETQRLILYASSVEPVITLYILITLCLSLNNKQPQAVTCLEGQYWSESGMGAIIGTRGMSIQGLYCYKRTVVFWYSELPYSVYGRCRCCKNTFIRLTVEIWERINNHNLEENWFAKTIWESRPKVKTDLWKLLAVGSQVIMQIA